MMSDELDHELDSLVDQLKQSNKENKQAAAQPENYNLTPEEVEQFVIQNSSKLITQSLSVIDEVKDYAVAAGDPDSLSSLSELIRASSSALETLNKITIQDKRTRTTLAVKKMDIDAKTIDAEQIDKTKLIGTREEMFKKVIKDAEVVEDDSNSHQKDQPQ